MRNTTAMFLLLLALGGGGTAASGFHMFRHSDTKKRLVSLEQRITLLELAVKASAPPVLRGISQAPGPTEGFQLGKHKLTPGKVEPATEKLPARTPQTLGGERRPPQPRVYSAAEHGEYILAKPVPFAPGMEAPGGI